MDEYCIIMESAIALYIRMQLRIYRCLIVLSQVLSRYKKGDIKGAVDASKVASRYSMLSFALVLFLGSTLALLIICATLFAIFYGIDYARGIHYTYNN